MTPETSAESPACSAREGATTDWGALIRAHDRTVFLSVLARGVRPTKAREFVDDAWSRLFEQWQARKLSALDLPGLAITQAAYLSRNQVRRDLSSPISDSLDAPAAVAVVDPSAGPEQRLLGRQLVQKVEQALADCPPRSRELFEAARENPEVPHAELARHFGISVQRFRQSLCEVRARLRRVLEGDAE